MIRQQRNAFWSVALLLGVLTASNCRAEMQVFGDSLSETGNFYATTFGLFPPAPLYDHGRFCNGPVWVERLANALGEPLPAPSVLGGTNYAFNGARAAGTSPYGTPELALQVADYLAVNAGVADGADVFVIWAGANDILLGSGEADFLPNAVQGVAEAIRDLHAAGARDFIVLDLPALGRTPFFNTQPAVAKELDLAAAAFNSLLATALRDLRGELAEIRIADVQISQLFQSMIRFPRLFGLRNVKDSATDFDLISGIGYQLKPGADPERYLFWDSVHPTAHTQHIVALYAYIDFRFHCRDW